MANVTFSGPFFTKDPAKTFRANARSMMRGVSLEGEAAVKDILEAGESGRAPISNGVTPVRVSGHVASGIPYTPQGGKRSKTGAILVNVYVPNFGMTRNEGRALMAAYSRVEQETHAFRKTATRLRKARAINVAELLDGIA